MHTPPLLSLPSLTVVPGILLLRTRQWTGSYVLQLVLLDRHSSSLQHRLGQTRPVTTIKLIIENSIEARLLEVQKKKTELANLTLNQPSKSEMMTRRMEELQQLFQ